MPLLDKNEPLVIASHNKFKIGEITAVVGDHLPHLTSARELGIDAPAETGDTCLANATIKGHAVAIASGKTALADDSGFFVPVLDGFPGVITHDYVDTFPNTDAAYGALHARAREKQPDGPIKAYTFCVFVLVSPAGEAKAFEGRVDGTFVYPAQGESSFGFDPYFIPDGETQSYAQLSPERKNSISSRGRALQAFLGYIAGA